MLDVLAEVPLVSMKAQATDPDGFARDIGRSFERFGFAMVADHGVPQEVVDRAWEMTKAFFALPDAEKRGYFVEGGGGARGYTPYKTEIAKGAAHVDLKEFWHVGRELPAGHRFEDVMSPNVWPDRPEGFRDTFLALFEALDRAGDRLLSAIARYLQLAPDWFDHAVGDAVLFGVEAHDEARDDEHAGAMNFVDAVGQAAARVLLLLHLHERLGIRTFDPGEHADEVRRVHQLQQFVVIGKVQRGFGRELERIIVLFQPAREMRQERLHGLLVADQVVVDEIDVAAIAEFIEPIEFRQHLRRRLGARHASVQFDDVAEFASERTAARELHTDIHVVLRPQEVEAGNRAAGDIDLELRRPEAA